MGPAIGLAIVAAVVFYATVWPYLLGAKIATTMGASNPSTTRSLAAWSLESVYLLAIAVIATVLIGSRISERRDRVEASEDRRAAEKVEDAGKSLRALERERDEAEFYVDSYEDALVRLEEASGGTTSAGTPPGERTLLVLRGVQLAQPRVAYRHGPKVLTAIEEGELHITDTAIQFVGPTKNVEWKLSKLSAFKRDEGTLGFVVRDRENISGVAGVTHMLNLVQATVMAAQATPGGNPEALSFIEGHLAQQRAFVATAQAKLAKHGV